MTPTSHQSSFTTSMNHLWDHAFLILPGSPIFTILPPVELSVMIVAGPLQRVTFFLYVQATGSNNYKKKKKTTTHFSIPTDWNKGRLCVRRRHHQTEKMNPVAVAAFSCHKQTYQKKR